MMGPKVGNLISGVAVLMLLMCLKYTIANSNIVFKLSARNLPTYDPFGGYPDPYVTLSYENPPNPPLDFGETSKLVDTPDPDWPEVFNVIYTNGSSQRLVLDVYDEDVDSDDLMGSVTIYLEEIVTTFGGALEKDILLNNSTQMGQIRLLANVTTDSK
ncbi:Extended synaptotagmin-3 [Orchesella cincta]|uniref:Extended synaptotagmin-3 n=1 Tax=Orchesella cincta TaxID=48709 RepID=A0A1D2MGK5_ORCCI|nr:Extended synaptotagmin-3 [Orchesella cincta]